MVFVGELAVKLHTKNVDVGTSLDRNPRQDQVTIGNAQSHGATNDKTHYSFSFVRIQYHAPVIVPLLNPSQIPIREAATAGLSAGLRLTASSVESSA